MRSIRLLAVSAFALFAASGALAQQPAAPAAPPPLPQAPNMSFFVTGAGSGKGADLGGIEGADRHCQTLAERHGAGGKTWRAYLSTQPADGKPAVNARDRIGKGPWQNFKGTAVAASLDELHSDNNKLGFDNSLSERGLIIAQCDERGMRGVETGKDGEKLSGFARARRSIGCIGIS